MALEQFGPPRSAKGLGDGPAPLIRTIDSLWVEHLTELDDMRRGIGLRGYAQQDPLNEFKREAFQLYDELRGLIRHGVASSIFRVTVTRQPLPTDGDPAVAASLARGARRCRRERCQWPAGGRRTGQWRGPGASPPPPRSVEGASGGRPPRPPDARLFGDQPTGDGVGPATGQRTAPVHARRRADAQRSVLVRVGRNTKSVTGAEPGAASLAQPEARSLPATC